MSRILNVELKRIVKTKLTLVLIVVAVLISVVLASDLANGMRIYDREYNLVYTGKAAIQKAHELASRFEGDLTTEKLLEANREYVAAAAAYGGTDNMPEEVYQEKIWPVRDLVNIVGEVTNDPETGFTILPEDRSDADVTQYYENRTAQLEKSLSEKQFRRDPQGLKSAMELNSKVQEPFHYASSLGWLDAGENIVLMLFILAIVCAAISAPVFSSDYQTGADSILRSAKFGRGKLAASKIAASLIVSMLLFVVCMAIMVGIFVTSFGTAGLAASVQIDLAFCIAPLTFGSAIGILIASGLLTIIAVVCFSLFVSSKSKAPMVALIVALAMIVLPTIIRIAGGGNITNWIRLCLPSGGMGLGCGMFYELLFQTNFLHIGDAYIWSPYVIIGAAIVCVIAFMLLSVRSYKRHEVA